MTNQLPALQVEALPEEFFIDIAVGVNSFTEICDNYEITEPQSVALENDPVFQRRLRMAQEIVETDGTAFKARCRAAVTNSVHNVVHMMQDVDVPASTQLDAFKTLVKYGGLEPVKSDDGVGTGPQLVLNIVAPDGTNHNFGAAQQTVEADFTEVADDASPILDILPPEASNLFGAE